MKNSDIMSFGSFLWLGVALYFLLKGDSSLGFHFSLGVSILATFTGCVCRSIEGLIKVVRANKSKKKSKKRSGR